MAKKRTSSEEMRTRNPKRIAPGDPKKNPVQHRIVSTLRSEIVSGMLAPGSRLPGRPDLGSRFNASSATVQNAMWQLMDEGFVTVHARRKGTSVALVPPHLSHYKLIFPFGDNTPLLAARSLFWKILEEEALRFGHEHKRISTFHGVSGHGDIAAFHQLIQDVREQRLAGLIFASSAQEFAGTPLLEEKHLPRVAVATRPSLPGVPKLYFDMPMLAEKALDYFIACGRRKVGVMYSSGLGQNYLKNLVGGIEKRGMETRPEWIQFPDPWSPMSARRATHLLMTMPIKNRPDALLILDDHLTESVAEGVLDAGVKTQDLQIVAHANFPETYSGAVPIRQIGFDIPQLLSMAVERIDRQRRGEACEELVFLPAVFEDELTAFGR